MHEVNILGSLLDPLCPSMWTFGVVLKLVILVLKLMHFLYLGAIRSLAAVIPAPSGGLFAVLFSAPCQVRDAPSGSVCPD